MEASEKKHSAIEVSGLSLAYREKPVLWDYTGIVETGSLTAILGPNGAGKSTLIKGILQLMKPLKGEVLIFGEPFKKNYKKIAYVPQIGAVNWDFPATVFDVTLMGRYSNLGWVRRPGRKDKQLALEALRIMGMEKFKNRQISELSGGQRQRVFLARAIAEQAEIYILDEPLAGVDKASENMIMSCLKGFCKEGKTVLVVHHDLNTVKEYFSHVILLNRVKIVDGPTEEIFTRENIARTYGEGKILRGF